MADLILRDTANRETYAGAVIKPSLLAGFVDQLAKRMGVPEDDYAEVYALIEFGAALASEVLRPYNESEAHKFRNLSVAANFARMGKLDDDMAAADDLAFQAAVARGRGKPS